MIISEIQKNMKEVVRISVEEYKGHKFVDCRVYWQDEAGDWKPSKKGIALNDECLDGVIEGLQKASKALEG